MIMMDDDLVPEPTGDALSLAVADLSAGGYSTIVLPPDLLCREDRLIWERVRTRTLLGLPPANGFERVIRQTLSEARKIKEGDKITVAAVFAAVRMALAKQHGIRIKTHPKGVALHLGIRYQTFLRLRAAAGREAEAARVKLDLPEWLAWDWS